MKRSLHILFISFAAIFVCLSSCEEAVDPAIANLEELMASAKTTPNKGTFDAYFTAVNDFLQTNKTDKAKVKPVLESAAQFASGQNQHGKATSYFMPLVKNYSADCKANPDHILSLAQSMNRLNKGHAAMIIYANYVNDFPTGAADEQLATLFTTYGDEPTVYIDTLFAQVFRDPDQFGLNRNVALKFVDATEAYAISAPCSDKTPEYLYRAGEIARSIRTLPKALSIYDWILESYPDYEKTPTVYFLKGFMMENNVQDQEAAREIYEDFLVKYPTHEMADDVQFLLDNLGKSDEEILEFLEKQQKKGE